MAVTPSLHSLLSTTTEGVREESSEWPFSTREGETFYGRRLWTQRHRHSLAVTGGGGREVQATPSRSGLLSLTLFECMDEKSVCRSFHRENTHTHIPQSLALKRRRKDQRSRYRYPTRRVYMRESGSFESLFQPKETRLWFCEETVVDCSSTHSSLTLFSHPCIESCMQ